MRAVDFFCGVGGFSEGARQAGIPVIAALDNDRDCEQAYGQNHPKTDFICEDISKFTPQALKDRTGISRRADDMVFIGCAPCQYWSAIRHIRDKAHISRNLLTYFRHFVEFFKPGFVVVENVTGIVRHRQESGLGELCAYLESKGYSIPVKEVLSVKDFGVPQTRRRFVLIASRHKDIELLPTTREAPTVRGVIGHLNPIKAGMRDPQDPMHKSMNLSMRNIKRLKKTKTGGDRSGWMNDEELMIDCYRNRPISYHRYNFGRMAWDKPAPTITTKFISLGCGQFGHPEQNRAISLREGALLQTFPEKYVFPSKFMTTNARLVGNAVPPSFGYEILKSIAC